MLEAYETRTTRPAVGVNEMTAVCVASGASMRMAFTIWNGPSVSSIDDFSWARQGEIVSSVPLLVNSLHNSNSQ